MTSRIPHRYLSLFYAFGVGVVVAALIVFGAYQELKILRTQELEQKAEIANSIKDRLELAIQYSAATTSTLGYIIEQEGNLSNFDSIARYLISGSKFIDVIEVLDKGVITHVYPLKGNESVIGYDILADPKTRQEAQTAITKHQLYFAGPLDLKQGGQAVIGRLPLFRDGVFIGFTAVLIHMNTLVQAAGIDTSLQAAYTVQLGKIDPNTGKKKTYFPGPKLDPSRHITELAINQGNWVLCVQERSPVSWVRVSWILVFAIFAAVLSGVFTYRLAEEPARLRSLVDKQIEKIALFEKERDLILESIGDAFFNLDHDLKITYWNRQAENLLRYERGQVIGKSLLDIFGEFIDPSIWKNYDPSKKLQEPIHFKQEIPRLGKWFEVSVYPHDFGNAVYFSDITSSVKSLEAINFRNAKLSEIAWIQSHVVRAPLARMMGIIELLEKQHHSIIDEEERLLLHEELLKAAKELDQILHEIVDKANRVEHEIAEESVSG